MNIAVIGQKKCGKTSILKVVFQKMSPNETWFIESSNRVEVVRVQNNHYIQFTMLDFPGNFNPNQMSTQERNYLENAAVVIFVLDAQDEPYSGALDKLVKLMTQMNQFNPNAKFEVFVHKIDGDMFLNEEVKHELSNRIYDDLRFELSDRQLPDPEFHMTSIYDLSIYEALSKVIHKITPQVHYLTNLLDSLLTNCRLEKVYIFDVISKIYIATDSIPVDLYSYELCTDMIDMVIDVSCIYGMGEKENFNQAFDSKSSSITRLDNGLTLYLREIDHLLALVCIVRDENFDRQLLIDYNIDCLKEGISRIFRAREEIGEESKR